MNAIRVVSRSGLLIGFWIVIAGPAGDCRDCAPEGSPVAGTRFARKLAGDDARHAGELDKAIEAALKADRWDEAIARAEELLALRRGSRAPKHFETVDAERLSRRCAGVAPMPHEDRVAYQSARTMNEQAKTLLSQGKYCPGPAALREGAGDPPPAPHRRTSRYRRRYNNLAYNLNAQRKYAQAQPLFEKALEIHRRLLTDDHPDTAGELRQPGASTSTHRGIRAGPAAVRESTGDPPPTPHRRPPRHRRELQQPGDQPLRPGEVRRRPSRCTRRRWRSAAACSPTTTPTPPKLQQPGGQPLRPGEIRGGPATVREGAGDRPPAPHRRPPRHRHKLQQPGDQPQRSGKVRGRPSRCTRRRWRSAAASSPTITQTPP